MITLQFDASLTPKFVAIIILAAGLLLMTIRAHFGMNNKKMVRIFGSLFLVSLLGLAWQPCCKYQISYDGWYKFSVKFNEEEVPTERWRPKKLLSQKEYEKYAKDLFYQNQSYVDYRKNKGELSLFYLLQFANIIEPKIWQFYTSDSISNKEKAYKEILSMMKKANHLISENQAIALQLEKDFLSQPKKHRITFHGVTTLESGLMELSLHQDERITEESIMKSFRREGRSDNQVLKQNYYIFEIEGKEHYYLDDLTDSKLTYVRDAEPFIQVQPKIEKLGDMNLAYFEAPINFDMELEKVVLDEADRTKRADLSKLDQERFSVLGSPDCEGGYDYSTSENPLSRYASTLCTLFENSNPKPDLLSTVEIQDD